VTPTIRRERPGERARLRHVIESAFAGKPYADGDEAELLDALQRHDALSLSLVAEVDGCVVGQAAFSPATPAVDEGRWFALGPVAVLPEFQGRGLGSRLVLEGLHTLEGEGADGCILVGDPAYYSRLGFHLASANAPTDQPAHHFMVKVLRGSEPRGTIQFHRAFRPDADVG